MTIDYETLDAHNLRCDACWELGKKDEPIIKISFSVGTITDTMFLCQGCADDLQQKLLWALMYETPKEE